MNRALRSSHPGWLLAAGLALGGGWACEDEKPPGEPVVVAGPDRTIDTAARPGRVFLYLDDGGQVIRTERYEDIPPAKRAAVMVIEGTQRGRVRKAASGGGIRIEALPPRISARPGEEQAGAAAAPAILDAHGPAEGPPSTSDWDDAQWREEIRRELLELHEEQAKDAPPER